MMICIAQPLFVHAADVTPVHEYTEIEEIGTEEIPANIQSRLMGLQYMLNSNAYEENSYFFYTVYKKTNGTSVRYYEIFYSFSEATVSFENGYLDINFAVNPTGKSTNEKIYWYNKGSSASGYDDYKTGSTYTHVVMRWGDTISIDFYDRNGNNYSPRMGTSGDVSNGFCTFVTNIPEIQPQRLSVLVDFSPDLIGNVDRQITATDGTKSMRKDLAMEVINQSNFPIQYDMRIYKVNQNSSRDWSLNPETFATQFDSDSVSYDDDPVFIYYKNEWVYTTNYDSESTFWDLEPVKENKGASWHYLAANSQDIVTFNFTQINLDENVDYYVEVRAVRNDYGCSSEKIVYLASDNPAVSEYKQIQGDDIVTVYHEQFKMINYSDVVYNPNEDSNGVLPYNGKNGIVSRNTYQYGRNARDNGNGNIDYTARNLYTDQNSWYNQQYHRVVSNHTSTASSGSVPSNITNLFDSFMKFVSYVFLRFPANMQTIYVYGFVSVVVLGIVLKVIK